MDTILHKMADGMGDFVYDIYNDEEAEYREALGNVRCFCGGKNRSTLVYRCTKCLLDSPVDSNLGGVPVGFVKHSSNTSRRTDDNCWK